MAVSYGQISAMAFRTCCLLPVRSWRLSDDTKLTLQNVQIVSDEKPLHRLETSQRTLTHEFLVVSKIPYAHYRRIMPTASSYP